MFFLKRVKMGLRSQIYWLELVMPDRIKAASLYHKAKVCKKEGKPIENLRELFYEGAANAFLRKKTRDKFARFLFSDVYETLLRDTENQHLYMDFVFEQKGVVGALQMFHDLQNRKIPILEKTAEEVLSTAYLLGKRDNVKGIDILKPYAEASFSQKQGKSDNMNSKPPYDISIYLNVVDGDYDAVKRDIDAILKDSQKVEYWEKTYSPLFLTRDIKMAKLLDEPKIFARRYRQEINRPLRDPETGESWTSECVRVLSSDCPCYGELDKKNMKIDLSLTSAGVGCVNDPWWKETEKLNFSLGSQIPLQKKYFGR